MFAVAISQKLESGGMCVNCQNQPKVGVFFCADGEILFHGCSLNNGEPYGFFINHPESHYHIWVRYYERKYNVEFDYYPRGRVIYRTTDDTYLIYYDRCMEEHLPKILESYREVRYEVNYDEHYQCHQCNPHYVNIKPY